jgi:hypothetical protein
MSESSFKGILMEYLSATYGLTGESDPVSENGQLFLAEYLLLLNKLTPEAEIAGFKSCMNYQLNVSMVEEGLYNRNPFLTEETMSHDNLIGIMSYSYVYNTQHKFKIWSYLLKHFGTYDNTKGKEAGIPKYLPFNPGNYFTWGLCANSNIYLLFLPFFLINLIISCNSAATNTSGKILDWVALYPHRNHWLVKYIFDYYEIKMIDEYGTNYLTALMEIYHGGNSHDFPINKLLGI